MKYLQNTFVLCTDFILRKSIYQYVKIHDFLGKCNLSKLTKEKLHYPNRLLAIE